MGRTLAHSRNMLSSTEVGYTRKTVTEQIDVTVAPRIDIDEPIVLVRDVKTFVNFRYFTGNLAAHRPFGMEFYRTEADAEQGIDRLLTHLPSYKLYPNAPLPFPNENFEGRAKFYVPSNWPYETVWGKIIIENDNAVEDVERVMRGRAFDASWRSA
ncbi:MAG: hypothetical protein OXU23_17295 [Candidatus Poribacteria bacterium]|nr:hypothetical protein [Candidatus Poribacteria bacterium]